MIELSNVCLATMDQHGERRISMNTNCNPSMRWRHSENESRMVPHRESVNRTMARRQTDGLRDRLTDRQTDKYFIVNGEKNGRNSRRIQAMNFEKE